MEESARSRRGHNTTAPPASTAAPTNLPPTCHFSSGVCAGTRGGGGSITRRPTRAGGRLARGGGGGGAVPARGAAAPGHVPAAGGRAAAQRLLAAAGRAHQRTVPPSAAGRHLLGGARGGGGASGGGAKVDWWLLGCGRWCGGSGAMARMSWGGRGPGEQRRLCAGAAGGRQLDASRLRSVRGLIWAAVTTVRAAPAHVAGVCPSYWWPFGCRTAARRTMPHHVLLLCGRVAVFFGLPSAPLRPCVGPGSEEDSQLQLSARAVHPFPPTPKRTPAWCRCNSHLCLPPRKLRGRQTHAHHRPSVLALRKG